MKPLLALAMLFLPVLAHAAPARALFGTQRFAPATNHQVTGPLVQLQTTGGATLSFQQGAQFKVDDDGTISLTSGNLRIGPVASTPLTLKLPQGVVTVAPNTALTITAQATKTTGRIYQGEATTQGTTFSNGQGFVLTPSGARGTFTPNAAQTPAPSPVTEATPATHLAFNRPATPEPQPEPTQPEQTEPETSTEQPPLPTTPEQEDTPDPQPEIPPETQPETGTPTQPHNPPETGPEETPEEIPQPNLPPVTIRASNVMASFSQQFGNVPQPDNIQANAGTFTLNAYQNGLHELLQTETTDTGTNAIRLSIGTALQADTFSTGGTAGLGRWVGGELLRTSGRQSSLINNTFVTVTADETTTIIPNSLHYVWGERSDPATIPTSGRITYALAAATQPTYTGTAQALGAGTFTGNLSIDFTTPVNSMVGTYHFSGAVTMPQTMQTETGPTTANVTYHIATDPAGIPLSSKSFANMGALSVAAPASALACPTGCTGTVNAAGFGNGMSSVGTLYAINPTGETGINGAALFTANP